MLDGEYVPFYIDSINRINAEKAVVRFQYVQSETKAARILNREIFSFSTKPKPPEKELNLIGWKVYDENLGDIGVLEALDLNQKNPMMMIAKGSDEILIPFREEFIQSFDKVKQVIFVITPEGLLDLYLNK